MQRHYRERLPMSDDYMIPKHESIRPVRSTSPSDSEFKLEELAMLSITPVIRSIHRWWLQRAERHYLICADVELQRAREAQMNVAYYQKRAALARSARH